MDFPHLFSPLRIGRFELRNRLFVPAHQEMFAEDNLPGERLANYYRLRARSGAAMQITGNTAVSPAQRADMGPARLTNIDDSIVPGYQLISRAVHEEGGLLLAQLSHSGLLARSANMRVVAASEYRPERSRESAAEIAHDEMGEILEDYRRAAERVRWGGMDGVELLMARGSLLSTFLSPAFNRRTDEWGGDFSARLRFPLRVLEAVRRALGPDAIVGVRMSADDAIAGGITPDLAAEIGAKLAASGHVDYLNVTGGTPTHRVPFTFGYPATPTPFGLFRHLAATVREASTVPVACVGRVTDPAVAEDILASGDADLVGVVRAQIADPGFFAKARTGRTREIRPCVGANVCANVHMTGKPVRCVSNSRVGLESPAAPAPAALDCLVVGAGPAGLEAARVLAESGHRVRLLDRGTEVGGQVARWTRSHSRREFRRLLEWWSASLERLGVRLELGTEVDHARLAAERPDHLVVATGSRPVTGLSERGTLSVWDALDAEVAHQDVLVVDEMGQADAVLVAERLAESGNHVTLATSCLHVAEGEGEPTLYPLLLRLNELGVRVLERARVVPGEDDAFEVREVFGGGLRETLRPGLVVHHGGYSAVDGLAGAARHAGVPVTVIGDARQPRRVHDVVGEASAIAELLRARKESSLAGGG